MKRRLAVACFSLASLATLGLGVARQISYADSCSANCSGSGGSASCGKSCSSGTCACDCNSSDPACAC